MMMAKRLPLLTELRKIMSELQKSSSVDAQAR